MIARRFPRSPSADVLVFAALATLEPQLVALARELRGPAFLALLGVSLGSYTLGAFLKRRRLRRRLLGPEPAARAPIGDQIARSQDWRETWHLVAAGILALAHLPLFYLTFVFAADAVPKGPQWSLWLSVPLAVLLGAAFAILCALPALFVSQALLAPGEAPPPLALPRQPGGPWQDARSVERWADALITLTTFLSIPLFIRYFGAWLSSARTLPEPLQVFAGSMFLVLFAIFYLAPRLLFLAEEYRSPWTWFAAATAFATLARATLLAAPRH